MLIGVWPLLNGYLYRTEKEEYFAFQFPGKKLSEIKKCLLNLFSRTLPFCILKFVFKCTAKVLSRFPFKDVRPKNNALLGYCVIAAMLFIATKENVVFTSGQPNIWEYHVLQTKMLIIINSQLFQITYYLDLVNAT